MDERIRDEMFFYEFLLSENKRNKKYRGYSEYGSRVLFILNEFKEIKLLEERMAFQKAIEKILLSGDKDLVEFGVAICTGFIVFRDSIE